MTDFIYAIANIAQLCVVGYVCVLLWDMFKDMVKDIKGNSLSSTMCKHLPKIFIFWCIGFVMALAGGY